MASLRDDGRGFHLQIGSREAHSQGRHQPYQPTSHRRHLLRGHFSLPKLDVFQKQWQQRWHSLPGKLRLAAVILCSLLGLLLPLSCSSILFHSRSHSTFPGTSSPAVGDHNGTEVKEEHMPRPPITLPASAWALSLVSALSSLLLRASSPPLPPPSAPPSAPFLNFCPPQLSLLYNLTRHQGAQHVIATKGSFLPLWAPLPWTNRTTARFIVVLCNFGQASNQLLCLRKHMMVAGYLNRTVVVTTATTKANFQWPVIFDVSRVRRCFGPDTAITTDEYESRHKMRVEVDAQLQVWGMDVEEGNMGNIDVSEAIHVKSNPPLDFDHGLATLRAWQDNASVITLHDIISAPLPPDAFLHGDLPFRRSAECPDALAIAPHDHIMHAAAEFAEKEVQGLPFLSVHVRRHDFLVKYCSTWGDGPPTATVCLPPYLFARCLAQKVSLFNVSHAVLLVYAAEGELQALEEELRIVLGDSVKLHVNPSPPSEGVANGGNGGYAAFQKAVAALAQVFLGFEDSTFSADIERMRIGLGKASCNDSFLCEGYKFVVTSVNSVFESII